MNPANLVAKSVLGAIAAWVFSIRRSTWLVIALLTTIVLTLLVWAALSLFGWFFGMAKEGLNAAPEALRLAGEQVTKSIPGVEQALGKLPLLLQPAASAPPDTPTSPSSVPSPVPSASARDVSGNDLTMVERYPGLTRVHWQREGQETTVRYEGAAEYFQVLDHYVKGFTSQGFTQHLVLAKPDEERHEYRQGETRVDFSIVRKNLNIVTVSLTSRLP